MTAEDLKERLRCYGIEPESTQITRSGAHDVLIVSVGGVMYGTQYAAGSPREEEFFSFAVGELAKAIQLDAQRRRGV